MMILCEKEITLFSYSRSFIRNLTSFGLVLAQCHNLTAKCISKLMSAF